MIVSLKIIIRFKGVPENPQSTDLNRHTSVYDMTS